MYFFVLHIYVHFSFGGFQGFGDNSKLQEILQAGSTFFSTFILHNFLFIYYYKKNGKSLRTSIKGSLWLKCFWKADLKAV